VVLRSVPIQFGLHKDLICLRDLGETRRLGTVWKIVTWRFNHLYPVLSLVKKSLASSSSNADLNWGSFNVLEDVVCTALTSSDVGTARKRCVLVQMRT